MKHLDQANHQALLKDLYKKARAIEQSYQLQTASDDSVPQELTALVETFQTSSDPFLTGTHATYQRLFLSRRVATPQDWQNFLVPIERALDISVKDSDFLVSSTDLEQAHFEKRSQVSDCKIVFLLDHLRSAFNVGNIFRLADAIGHCHIDLIGYTPKPDSDKTKKSALGSQLTVPWQNHLDLSERIVFWQSQGFQVVALETAAPSAPLFSAKLYGRVAFIVGNERFGLNQSILKLCDQVVHLPMSGTKNSLNVANCLSVASFEWKRQNQT